MKGLQNTVLRKFPLDQTFCESCGRHDLQIKVSIEVYRLEIKEGNQDRLGAFSSMTKVEKTETGIKKKQLLENDSGGP